MSDRLVASVVIPVYNKENYLDRCFRSLLNQTIDHKLMEAIFVDDGSTDGSLKYLKQFEGENEWVVVVSKPNEGVCSARNAGINEAQGRFIFFLDPDDELSENALEKVSSFFHDHYDEIDLVTYPIYPVSNGKKEALHSRYRVLKDTGIYDLNEGKGYQICQTTMNVCVKNEFEKNVRFSFASTNGKIFHEDQAYITDVVLRKMKIGFCNSAKYIWNKNPDSVSSDLINSYSLFDNTILMYEELFSRFGGSVPRYVQGLLVNDMGWKMRSNVLLPTHLRGAEYDKAVARLVSLIERIDDEILLRHPNMHQYHALFFMSLKRDTPMKACVGPDTLALVRDGEAVWVGSKVEVLFLRTRIEKGNLDIIGFIKSPVFLFYDGLVELKAIRQNGSSRTEEDIELVDSSWSRCASKHVTARFYGFRYTCKTNDAADVTFEVRLNGVPVKAFISCFPKANFSKELHNSIILEDRSISLVNGATVLRIKRLSYDASRKEMVKQSSKLDRDVRLFRNMVRRINKWKLKRSKSIWIYTDGPGKVDNAWLQFQHDASMDDGVLRFYAANGTYEDVSFASNRSARVISFRSRVHKLLFVAADKLLCSDVSQACYNPLGPKARPHYSDMMNAEMIYLQHGVLWAHLPWYYSYDRILFDREVVSTVFEIENLTKNYGFRDDDLIRSGMPRYDNMDCDCASRNKILLCPSWRDYLIGKLTKNGREPMRDKFERSDYFQGLSKLLHDSRLVDLLERNGYELHLKLHPQFECYSDLFSFQSEMISFAPSAIDETEYAIVITDYSSYSFDFVYLRRALVYYIPDEELFLNGINHYDRLDISLDEAFGEYAHSVEDVVDAIGRILANRGRSLPEYEKRQEGFFLHYDNSQAERLYRALLD